jgi:hypothetical protein
MATEYNEGVHVTSVFPTQGHINMEQQVKIYDNSRFKPEIDFQRDADLQFKSGWYVQTAVAHHFINGDRIVVVYRRTKK